MTGTIKAPLDTLRELETELRICHRVGILKLRLVPDEDGVVIEGEAASYYAQQLVIRDVMAAGLRISRTRFTMRSENGKPRAETSSEVLPRRAASDRRVLIATSDAALSNGCAERLQSNGRVVERVGDGLELLTRLNRGCPEVLVIATPLLWGGADGVIQRAGELDLLRRMKVVCAGPPEALTGVPAHFREQLASVVVLVGKCSTCNDRANLLLRVVEDLLASRSGG